MNQQVKGNTPLPARPGKEILASELKILEKKERENWNT